MMMMSLERGWRNRNIPRTYIRCQYECPAVFVVKSNRDVLTSVPRYPKNEPDPLCNPCASSCCYQPESRMWISETKKTLFAISRHLISLTVGRKRWWRFCLAEGRGDWLSYWLERTPAEKWPTLWMEISFKPGLLDVLTRAVNSAMGGADIWSSKRCIRSGGRISAYIDMAGQGGFS